MELKQLDFVEENKSNLEIVDTLTDQIKKILHEAELTSTTNLAYQEEYDKLKINYNRLQREIEDLKCQSAEKQSNIDTHLQMLTSQVAAKDKELAVLKGSIAGIQSSLASDLEAWRKKSIDLNHALSVLEKKSQQELNQVKGQAQAFEEKSLSVR